MANTCRKKSLLCTQGLGLVFPGAGTSQPYWLNLPLPLPVLGKLWWSQRRACCFPFAFVPPWEVWQSSRPQAHSLASLLNGSLVFCQLFSHKIQKRLFAGSQMWNLRVELLVTPMCYKLVIHRKLPTRWTSPTREDESYVIAFLVSEHSHLAGLTADAVPMGSHSCPLHTQSSLRGSHHAESMGSHALFLTQNVLIYSKIK